MKRTRVWVVTVLVATTLMSVLVGCGSSGSTEVQPDDAQRSNAVQDKGQ